MLCDFAKKSPSRSAPKFLRASQVKKVRKSNRCYSKGWSHSVYSPGQLSDQPMIERRFAKTGRYFPLWFRNPRVSEHRRDLYPSNARLTGRQYRDLARADIVQGEDFIVWGLDVAERDLRIIRRLEPAFDSRVDAVFVLLGSFFLVRTAVVFTEFTATGSAAKSGDGW